MPPSSQRLREAHDARAREAERAARRRSTRSRPPIRSPARTPSSPSAPTGCRTSRSSGSPPRRRRALVSGRRPRRRSARRGRRSSTAHDAHLERVVDHDAALAPIAEALQSAGFLLADAATELAGYLAGLDADGARELEIVQERRALLIGLVRRHGGTLDDVLEFRRTGGLRLVELDGDDDRIEELEASVAGLAAEVDRLAARLTELRTDSRRTPRRRGHRRARGPRDARRAPHRRGRRRRTSPPPTAATRSRSCCSRTRAPSRGRSRAAPPAVSSRG